MSPMGGMGSIQKEHRAQIRHRASGAVGVWCLVVLAPSATPFQIPSLFRKSFRKTGFSVRKPFPSGDSKISKSLKCAPVQAGTLPRGAKVSETHA